MGDFAFFWKVWETQRLLWRSKSYQEGVWSAQGQIRAGSGGDFGPNLAPTWAHLGSQNRAKKCWKTMRKGVNFWMAFGIQLGAVLGGFGERKWTHVGTQNRSQNGCHLRRADTANHPRNVIYFRRFWGRPRAKLASKSGPRWVPKQSTK